MLYYDSYTWVRRLSDQQKGRLLDAIFLYALTVKTQNITPQEFLEREDTGLDSDAAMVFGFMADTVYRDTDKWNRTQQTKAARREEKRLAAPTAGTGSVFPPARGY